MIFEHHFLLYLKQLFVCFLFTCNFILQKYNSVERKGNTKCFMRRLGAKPTPTYHFFIVKIPGSPGTSFSLCGVGWGLKKSSRVWLGQVKKMMDLTDPKNPTQFGSLGKIRKNPQDRIFFNSNELKILIVFFVRKYYIQKNNYYNPKKRSQSETERTLKLFFLPNCPTKMHLSLWGENKLEEILFSKVKCFPNYLYRRHSTFNMSLLIWNYTRKMPE